MNRSLATRLSLATIAIAGLQLWGIGRPSLWADEVATVAAASRPLPNLFHMLQFIDAVHGTYYVFMHFLGKLIGFGPVALRVPSALAITATAFVVFLLSRRLFGERLAWIALVVTAVLPRLTWAATEARSYGIDALLGALILYLFVLAISAEQPSRAKRLWVAYGVVLTLAIHFFIFIVLLAGAQGLWLLWQKRSKAPALPSQRQFGRWLLTTGISVAVSAYVIVWVILEKGQVGWLPSVGSSTITEIFVGQAFWAAPTLAFIANGVIAAFVLGARHHGHFTDSSERAWVGLLALGVAVPPAVILAYSVLGGSIYDSRYFTFTAPIVALLLALAIERLFSRWISYLALLLVVVLSMQAYFGFRALDAKGTHWGQVAHLIHKNSRPGDGILYTDFDRKSPSQSRISIAYPGDFKNVTDLTITVPYYRAIGLYPKRVPALQVASNFGKYKRILVLQVSTELPEYQKLKAILAMQGFTPTQRIRIYNTWLRVFTPTR